MNQQNLPDGWNNLDIIPPDTFVEVIDKNGNMAIAQPTYYPFEVVKKPGDENKPFGWRGTPVFHENGENKWDGGWMISVGMGVNEIGEIVGWKNIEQK